MDRMYLRYHTQLLNPYPISCCWYKAVTFHSFNCMNTYTVLIKIAWYMQYEDVLKVSVC